MLLRAPDGATAMVTCYGAHVVSWIPAGDDERLFLSPRSALGKPWPIRGGVPVVFPQFSTYGYLPNHGFARTLDWCVVDVDTGERDGRATFRLEDSSDTRKLWPHAFACELSVTVGGASLELQLRIENPGPRLLDFCAGLHTYLRVNDIHAVRLEGLHGARYRDRTDRDREVVDRANALTIGGEVDRIYLDAPNRLVVRDGGRSMTVRADGFPDVVVWNPGNDKCALLADMPNDAYRHMVCVEAAAISTPLTLDSGDRWTGSQTLIASDSA